MTFAEIQAALSESQRPVVIRHRSVGFVVEVLSVEREPKGTITIYAQDVATGKRSSFVDQGEGDWAIVPT